MPNKPTITIIGAGPGGYVAAIRARQLGFKVAVVERERVGGTCLNWGCVPTKALIKSAELYETLRKGGAYGLKADNLRFDLNAIVDRSRGISDRIVSGVEFLFKKYRIQSVKGNAHISGPNQVKVQTSNGEEILQSDSIIITTGARARDIPGVERDGGCILSYKEALQLRELPKRMVVIGGGALGMEFAYYFGALGSEITVIESKDRVLHHEDHEISQVVERCFTRKSIKTELNSRVKAIHKRDNDLLVEYESHGSPKSIATDKALVMIGVVPNVENLGLETLGIQLGKQGIRVNEHFQVLVSNQPLKNIYAIGDVIGSPWLAHAASAEGVHAVEHIAGLNPHLLDYNTIPACTYCRPEVASVGMTEQQAKDAGIDYTVGKFSFKANARAVLTSESDGMVKLLFEKQYGGLIGAHLVGGNASEMIHELVLGMRMEATAEDIGKAIHAHPTYSESIMEAALDTIGERIHGA